METFTTVGLAIAMVYTLVSLGRYVSARRWAEAKTIVLAGISGFAVAFVFAQSDVTVTLDFIGLPDTSLSDVNTYTQVLVGFAFASGAGVLADIVPSTKPKLGDR